MIELEIEWELLVDRIEIKRVKDSGILFIILNYSPVILTNNGE